MGRSATLAPRLVDLSLLLAVTTAFLTGLWTLVSGRPGEWWVFTLHGAAGLLLVVFLSLKLLRVAPRLHPSMWGVKTVASVLTLTFATGALATGVFWSSGGNFQVLRWNAMNVHVLFALLLIPPFVVHLVHRFRLPTLEAVTNRRTALSYAILVAGSVVAWRLQRWLVSALELAGERRFTSSNRRGAEPGNTFPVTMWVADDPDPLDPADWTLAVRGVVNEPTRFEFEDFRAIEDELRATLDCTSGWYTTQDWQGVRVSRVLDTVGVDSNANWVSFRSVTGYRFSLPIEEARAALLATHVGGERLSHGHGFPLRLVAPGRRGFQWVKWIETVEVRRRPDYGQWVAIFTSGFSGDGASSE